MIHPNVVMIHTKEKDKYTPALRDVLEQLGTSACSFWGFTDPVDSSVHPSTREHLAGVLSDAEVVILEDTSLDTGLGASVIQFAQGADVPVYVFDGDYSASKFVFMDTDDANKIGGVQ